MKALDPVVESVRQKLLDRSNIGIAKYGTTLADNRADLLAWLIHAQEVLDLANYLERAIQELRASREP